MNSKIRRTALAAVAVTAAALALAGCGSSSADTAAPAESGASTNTSAPVMTTVRVTTSAPAPGPGRAALIQQGQQALSYAFAAAVGNNVAVVDNGMPLTLPMIVQTTALAKESDAAMVRLIGLDHAAGDPAADVTAAYNSAVVLFTTANSDYAITDTELEQLRSGVAQTWTPTAGVPFPNQGEFTAEGYSS